MEPEKGRDRRVLEYGTVCGAECAIKRQRDVLLYGGLVILMRGENGGHTALKISVQMMRYYLGRGQGLGHRTGTEVYERHPTSEIVHAT